MRAMGFAAKRVGQAFEPDPAGPQAPVGAMPVRLESLTYRFAAKRGRGGASGLAENGIEGPAAERVVPRLAAVVEQVGVRAAGFFKGVGQERQVAERSEERRGGKGW